MSFNWINPKDFSFNCILLMDRNLVRIICTQSFGNHEEYQKYLGIALANNPAVKWYCKAKAPEVAETVDKLVSSAPSDCTAEEIKAAECFVLDRHDWAVVYVYPNVMNSNCSYIYEWDKQRLFELADFDRKIVLDVGSGTGRLAFAAAERAKHVYASEPVDELREFMREKIKCEGIKNMTVLDGFADCLPYEDSTFDIVMSAHVVGDDYDSELTELERVTRNGGWVLDCMGEDDRKNILSEEMVKSGYEYLYYVSKMGGDIYRYRKQVIKE